MNKFELADLETSVALTGASDSIAGPTWIPAHIAPVI